MHFYGLRNFISLMLVNGQRHYKYLLPAPAKAICGSFCRAESEISNVVYYTQIDLSTENDRACQLDCWAKFFKATTWEEIHMLAHDNEVLTEAATTIYQLTQEERIRMECEAREDYYRTQLGWQNMLSSQADQIEVLATEKDCLSTEVQSLTTEKESLSTKVQSLTAEVERLRKQLHLQGKNP